MNNEIDSFRVVWCNSGVHCFQEEDPMHDGNAKKRKWNFVQTGIAVLAAVLVVLIIIMILLRDYGMAMIH